MRAFRRFISLILFASVLTPLAAARADAVEWIPAGWVSEYAGGQSAASLTRSPVLPTAHLEKLSQMNLVYTNVPEIEKPAIQAAVDIWASHWKSSTPVTISAVYSRQASTSVLATATPVKFFRNFTNAPDKDLYYPSALANAHAGKDLGPKNPEIQININSVMASNFYLGTDGKCPGDSYDLESILLHELGHGLGFLSNNNYDSAFGYGAIDQPTPYDAYAQLPDGRRLMDLDSPSR